MVPQAVLEDVGRAVMVDRVHGKRGCDIDLSLVHGRGREGRGWGEDVVEGCRRSACHVDCCTPTDASLGHSGVDGGGSFAAHSGQRWRSGVEADRRRRRSLLHERVRWAVHTGVRLRSIRGVRFGTAILQWRKRRNSQHFAALHKFYQKGLVLCSKANSFSLD